MSSVSFSGDDKLIACGSDGMTAPGVRVGTL